jgi:hypothetical protein
MDVLGKLSNPQLELILSKRLPKILVRSILLFGKWISKRVPTYLIRLTPPVFSNILGQWAKESGDSEAKLQLWFRQAQKSPFSSKLGFAYESNLYINSLGPTQYIEFITRSLTADAYSGEKIENIRNYSMWNLDFNSNYLVLSKLKELLQNLDTHDKNDYFERYLPEFTSNMGHLGFNVNKFRAFIKCMK